MTMVLARISDGTLEQGPVYQYTITYGEEGSEVSDLILYRTDLLARWSSGELAAIDLEWIDTELPLPPYFTQIDQERDRRIALGYSFGGNIIQCRSDADWINIDMPAFRAHVAITQDGVLAGDLEWDTPGSDFEFITAANTIINLDAFEMIDMAKKIGKWRTEMYRAARALKDVRPEVEDVTDNIHWPPSTDA